MIPNSSKPIKKHYMVFRKGTTIKYETWAVSPKKAINNIWWKVVKEQDELTPRNYEPNDFDAVEL